ncbi:MAG TPA: metallophosphoesterase [Planctomycetota bacterium]|nr:metallophosphoesterase [Planctomycetota bacterium]
MNDDIIRGRRANGVERRGFLQCMAWAGTGLLWSASGGTFSSRLLGQDPAPKKELAASTLNFVQISDTHMGFKKAANPDVVATLRETIARINALPEAPAFILHTGDLTHLSAAKEFDALEQVLKECRTKQVFYVPGEHDVLDDEGARFRERFAKGTVGSGWFSFEQNGVHFVGLVNVLGMSEGGLGVLGKDQLAWLAKDLAPLSAETPVVVFAHVPLWTVHEKWGWGTADGARALELLKRFGSVTVLNGHIHQIVQKVEGNITFHSARSTAFPQPEAGKAEKPGPMLVGADQLRSFLGLTNVRHVENSGKLAIVDATLAGN